MKKELITDAKKLSIIFFKKKKQMAIAFIINILLLFVALAFVGTKLFYPYHFAIGLGFYIISFIPLVYRCYVSRKTFKKFRTYNFAQNFYAHRKWRILLAIFLGILMISFFTIRPSIKNPFSEMSDSEIKDLIDADLEKALFAMDYLEISGNNLVSILESDSQNVAIAGEIKDRFEDFLRAVVFSESITDVHRYFDSVPRFKLKDSRIKSFIIFYSLYTKKYEIVHRIRRAVEADEFVERILNEKVEELGRDDIYREMVARCYQPKTKLRIILGGSYLNFFYKKPIIEFGESFLVLQQKSKESFKYLSENFDKTIKNYIGVISSGTEDKMSEAWFPIQKNVLNTMGHIILANKEAREFITVEQIETMNKKMEPGDIMLQRRIAHLNNIGIPGFWIHSALYTGTLTEMNSYFSSEFPREGYKSFDKYMAGEFPQVYAEYQKLDKDGFSRSVLEAIEPGVVSQSLTVSAKADFVAVLRPRLDKKDKLNSILRSFENFGKPYDYDFDFDTRDALVCSELIYDAYLEIPDNKEGLFFKVSTINGRKIVFPTDIAQKFYDEYFSDNSELEFVYILVGNKSTRRAYVGTQEDFLDSLNWDKFNFL